MVSIVWREEKVWKIEGARIFGPNVLSFTVTSGQKLWYIIGAYVLSNNLPVVHQITHALTGVMEGVGELLVGELNACLAHTRYQREEHLATIIAIHVMKDQARNFMPRRRYRSEGNWMWRMRR